MGTKRLCRANHLEGAAQGKSAKPPNTASPSGERGHRTFTPQTQHNPAPGGRQRLMNKPTGRCGSSIQSWLCLQNSQSRSALNMPAWDGVGIWFSEGVSGGEESIHRGSAYTHTHLHDSLFLFSFLSLLFLLFPLLLHLGFPDGREIEGGPLISYSGLRGTIFLLINDPQEGTWKHPHVDSQLSHRETWTASSLCSASESLQ